MKDNSPSRHLTQADKHTDLGIIPHDWECCRLSELANRIGSGITPTGGERVYTVEGRAFLRSQNVGWGTLLLDELAFIPDHIHATFAANEVKAGDVLLNITGASIGRCAVADERVADGNVNQHVCEIRPNPDKLDSRYLNAYLLSAAGQKQIDSFQAGGNRQGLNYGQIASFLIPHPTVAEQRAIAEALSDVDGLLRALENLITKKRAIKQASMQQLLTGKLRLPGFSGKWMHTTLGSLIEGCSSGATPYRGRPDYYKGNVRWITSGELNYNYIVDTREHISNEAVRDTNLKMHPPGTFLMAITGLEAEGTRGSCGIVGAEATTNQSCMAVYPTDELLSLYLFHYYVYRGKSLALHYCQGTKQQSYTAKTVRLLPIYLPTDVEEQGTIAAILSDMDAEIEALERRRDKTKQIKQGMMQQLLTGRIRLVKPDTQAPATQVEADEKATKGHTWAINEAVIISTLAKHFGSEQFPLGRKRYTKLSYLLHRHVEKQAEGYLKKAAGPYNPKTRYGGPERIAVENGYVREHKSGPYSGFVAGDNIAQAESYFEKWYGRDTIQWLEQFRRRKNDDLELLATVDMAVEELRASGKTVNVEAVKAVIRNHKEWKAKLDRAVFSDNHIATAIDTSGKLFALATQNDIAGGARC